MFQPMAFDAGRSARGPALSVTIHCAAIALLFLAGANHNVQDALRGAMSRIPVIIEPYVPAGHGGGGGGGESVLPPSQGKLPRLAPHQFTPPSTQVTNLDPKLVMEPTLVISAEIKLPQVDLSVLGDPLAKPGPPSDGPGTGGGIGTGCCGGVGPGKGLGYGPGEGGDAGGGKRGAALSGSFTAPVLLFKVEPEFSEQARQAKLQGTVMLYAEVDTNGLLRNIRVTRGLGLGLDEKAVEAVKKWRFRPAYRGDQPVVEAAAIEVNFRLL